MSFRNLLLGFICLIYNANAIQPILNESFFSKCYKNGDVILIPLLKAITTTKITLKTSGTPIDCTSESNVLAIKCPFSDPNFYGQLKLISINAENGVPIITTQFTFQDNSFIKIQKVFNTKIDETNTSKGPYIYSNLSPIPFIIKFTEELLQNKYLFTFKHTKFSSKVIPITLESPSIELPIKEITIELKSIIVSPGIYTVALNDGCNDLTPEIEITIQTSTNTVNEIPLTEEINNSTIKFTLDFYSSVMKCEGIIQNDGNTAINYPFKCPRKTLSDLTITCFSSILPNGQNFISSISCDGNQVKNTLDSKKFTIIRYTSFNNTNVIIRKLFSYSGLNLAVTSGINYSIKNIYAGKPTKTNSGYQGIIINCTATTITDQMQTKLCYVSEMQGIPLQDAPYEIYAEFLDPTIKLENTGILLFTQRLRFSLSSFLTSNHLCPHIILLSILLISIIL